MLFYFINHSVLIINKHTSKSGNLNTMHQKICHLRQKLNNRSKTISTTSSHHHNQIYVFLNPGLCYCVGAFFNTNWSSFGAFFITDWTSFGAFSHSTHQSVISCITLTTTESDVAYDGNTCGENNHQDVMKLCLKTVQHC